MEQNILMKAPDVVNNQECELDNTPEINGLQQKKLEQINHEGDASSEKKSDNAKTKTIDVNSNLQEKTIVSESVIQPTLSFNMGPVELFQYFVSSTPRMIFILYLLILFTWSYLQRSPLLLLSLGVAFGYFLRANTVTNEIKEKIVMVKDTSMSRNLSSVEVLKSAEKVKLTELAITTNIDKTLDKMFKYITRDIVDFYYDPINPNKDPEFSIQVRNAMNVMAMNLALCFQNLDKVELGIMSSFAIANTFIVHLREYRKFIVTNTPLSVYCSQNESSVLTQSTNREAQAQILRSVSHLMLARLLPSSETHSHILMAFLSELWANQIFRATLDTVCDPDWINRTIVEYLTDISPIDAIDEHDATLFHELANSIEAAELAEKLTQPPDSSNFINENRSSISSNDSTAAQPNQPSTESSTPIQANLFTDSKTEICDEPIELVSGINVEFKNEVTVTDNTSSLAPPIVSPNRLFVRSNKSTNLQNILNNRGETFAEFMAFLEERKSANLLRFWLQADSFRKIATQEVDINLIQEDALGIFKSYFGETATYPVKVVEEGLVNQCVREITKAPTSSCFMMLQEYVFVVLERDYFDDFIKSMKTQGEDMSFLIKDKHPPEDDDKSSSLSEGMSVEERTLDRSNILGDSVLSSEFSEHSLPDENGNSEHLQVNPRRRSRSWSNNISVEALGELTKNIPDNSDANPTTSVRSEINDTESTHELITDRPKTPMMDLTGVRIKMTDVSESPNKYIYSTKSLGYMIEVEQPGSTGWIMTRSYADFEKMHHSLVRAFPKAEKVTMPRLMLKKNHEACEALERYLNILLSDVILCESDALQKFMKRDGLPKKDLEKPSMKKTRGLSILSAKSMSMVNLLTNGNDSKNQRNPIYEESSPPKRSSEILRSSEVAFKKFSEFLPRISTEFSKIPDELYGKNSPFTTVARPSIETINSTTWGSSRTTPTTSTSESDSSSIVMVDTPSNRSSIADKLENSYDITSDSGDINLISKHRARPNKQLTGQDIDLLIDTIFAVVEEIFDLSVKSQWHLRKTVLSVLREVVRRSYTEAIKASFLMYIDTLSTEEKVTSIIDNFTNSFWPNGTWAGTSPLRTEEEKLKTKEEAKKLLLQKAVPSSIKQVMGSENSRIMIGRLVDGFLAEKEVVRGMGVNILESIVKLIIAE
ncbi:PXA domain-containing protein [Glomus cerebriforme]|uniref:PXA domain-containing protein n=1 Tax=Glomus cerebriforme TaxID=658196 RepID=A0A397T440_9GLOM|nr:PXA domain-containing protein [Glomus cerebriforme]